MENWCFENAHILNCGRVNYPSNISEEERDQMKEQDP